MSKRRGSAQAEAEKARRPEEADNDQDSMRLEPGDSVTIDGATVRVVAMTDSRVVLAIDAPEGVPVTAIGEGLRLA